MYVSKVRSQEGVPHTTSVRSLRSFSGHGGHNASVQLHVDLPIGRICSCQEGNHVTLGCFRRGSIFKSMRVIRGLPTSGVESLRKFIFETLLSISEASTTRTAGTSATNPTASATKGSSTSPEPQTDEPQDQKNGDKKVSFVDKALNKAVNLTDKPPIGPEFEKARKGPGSPAKKIAAAAEQFGAGMFSKMDLEDVNPGEVKQLVSRAGANLAKQIQDTQEAQAELEKSDAASKTGTTISQKKTVQNPLLTPTK